LLVAISPRRLSNRSSWGSAHSWDFGCLGDGGQSGRTPVRTRVPRFRRAPGDLSPLIINLPFTNGDESWQLPIPATYILERDSTVLYASANEDYTERPEIWSGCDEVDGTDWLLPF